MADIEVELIRCPDLPNTIQGDGRYVMSLLKSYLGQINDQVNLANGFTAEEINPELGDYVTPRNFFLSFSRLGGELTWSPLYDETNLAYYEVRSDTKIGEQTGLLDRTTENNSYNLPLTRTSIIYLYAVSKDGKYSNPSKLEYTKPFPDSPQDISFTNTSEGVLITFTEIPTNCIGAYIYVDGNRYESRDNVFLYTATTEMEKIEVAYYDQFGEGEHGVLYIVLPDVEGFLVERNGSELDFYWDAVKVYGAKYVVKISQTPEWEQGVELFRTNTNAKNRYIYPNTGTYYLMIKAYDDNGNYSKNATYQIMNNEPEIDKNVILEFDQQEVLYNGTKINVWYDALVEGVTLNREADKGEYIFDVQLDQNYRARNWLEYKAISATNVDVMWQDANTAWKDFTLHWAGIVGDVDSSAFKQELATKVSHGADFLLSADLNGDIDEDGSATIIEHQHTDDFTNARWAQGLKTNQLTRLGYQRTLTRTFTMEFWYKLSTLDSCVLCALVGESGAMSLIYDKTKQAFYLRGTDGAEVKVDFPAFNDRQDYLFFAISQGVQKRRLYIYSYLADNTHSGEVEATPMGMMSEIYCYPKLSI